MPVATSVAWSVANTARQAAASLGAALPSRDQFEQFFTQDTRLIELETALPSTALLVERLSGREAISEAFRFELDCLSTSAHFELKQLVGEELTLKLSCADGSRRSWHGYVTSAGQLGADGGVARYRLVLEPWTGFLSRRIDTRLFQDRSLIDICDDLFAAYPQANYAFRLSAETEAALTPRSVTTQFREDDFAFFSRLLASEGLSFFFEHEQSATSADSTASHAHHQLVIVDSAYAWADATPASIHYHRLSPTERSDAIHHLAAQRQVSSNAVALSSWDYRDLSAHSASETTRLNAGELPAMEDYDGGGAYRFADPAASERQARLRLMAHELANKRYLAEGSVRTLAAGTAFQLSGHPDFSPDFSFDHAATATPSDQDTRLLTLWVEHQAANNLPKGGIRPLTPSAHTGLEAGTYRNRAGLVRAVVPVVPIYRPTAPAPGLQTALVVGTSSEAITTQRDGRIKIQFPWQRGERPNPGGLNTSAAHAPGDDRSGLWVRVAQAQAGPDWGASFAPRIGTEVLVDFLDGDIDRPVVIGGLYNGDDALPFAAGQDAASNHPGVLCGWHIPSLDSADHSQWVSDDAPDQLRSRLATTYSHSQLNLGYLIQPTGGGAGASRGRYRGEGFELASDAWGVLRATAGLLVSTHARESARSSQYDAAEALAKLTSARALGQALSQSAEQQGASALGHLPEQRGLDHLATQIDPQREGRHPERIGGQTTSANTATPGSAQPLILLDAASHLAVATPASGHAYAGQQWSLSAHQDLQASAGTTLSTVSGRDTSLYTHSGGAHLIAANGPVSLAAHSDELEILADQSLTVTSSNGSIDLLANQKITLTAGGAQITLEGSNITFACPGTFSVKGSGHAFQGPGSGAAKLAALPAGCVGIGRTQYQEYDEAFRLLDKSTGKPLANVPYVIDSPTGMVTGKTNDQGMTDRVYTGSAVQSVKANFTPGLQLRQFEDGKAEDEC